MKIKYIILLLILLLFINITPISVFASNEKVIYLTFDDGPGGKVTTDVLDILKKEDIKATFFLIGNQLEKQEALVKRIDSEGHSIGLHSISHDKSKLYCSSQAFLDEMLEEQKILNNITNKTYNIIRFPFGCNNSCYHLKSSLVDLLHQHNLKIYDWNVDTTDGANYTASPSTFITRSKSDKDTIYLLMHCGFMNKNSAKALPEIIHYYKENGYTFSTIDESTNEIFHYIKSK